MTDSVPCPKVQPFFPWSKDLETGIRIVDMDHKALVDTVNEFHWAWQQGHFARDLSNLLDVLFKYCTEHFDREEKIMSDYGYPGLQKHKEYHRGLRRFVYALKVVAREDPRRINPDKMLKFLMDWLTSHIGLSDMDYVEHIHLKMAESSARKIRGAHDDRLPAEKVSLDLNIPPNYAVLLHQVAAILRGKQSDALELDDTVQAIVTRNTFELAPDDCVSLVRDLLN